MNIVVITDDRRREELLAQNVSTDAVIEYREDIPASGDADCYLDLLFERTPERLDQLVQLRPSLIIVNSVVATLNTMPPGFIRINAWPTFLKRAIVEASCSDDDMRKKAEAVLTCFGKKTEWVAEVEGFITARVVSMIINEAYFALDEKISTKEEIDIAMKLGTNYPYGPFEWAQLIGLQNIYALLRSLSKYSRYAPSPLLVKEASST
jgi:3-hydroxybutyryl-CoA dehydrogenase